MKKRYTGVIKLGLLTVGLPAAVYMAAVSKSVGLWREYRANEAVIDVPHIVQSASNEANGEGGMAERNDILKNGELLDRLSETLEKNGVKAERYSPWLAGKTAGVELHVAQVVFNGGFIPLTKVLQEIDRRPELGQVLSAEYASFAGGREKKKELRLSLVLQQITETDAR